MSTTEATVQIERVQAVDTAVRERGWSLAVAHDLAKELGVDIRTVHRCWARAQKWTQRTMGMGDVARWRAHQVQLLGDTAIDARRAGDFAAVARLVDIQARIIGTIAPVKIEGRLQVEHTEVVLRELLDAVTGKARPIIDVAPEPAGLLAEAEPAVPVEALPAADALSLMLADADADDVPADDG